MGLLDPSLQLKRISFISYSGRHLYAYSVIGNIVDEREPPNMSEQSLLLPTPPPPSYTNTPLAHSESIELEAHPGIPWCSYCHSARDEVHRTCQNPGHRALLLVDTIPVRRQHNDIGDGAQDEDRRAHALPIDRRSRESICITTLAVATLAFVLIISAIVLTRKLN